MPRTAPAELDHGTLVTCIGSRGLPPRAQDGDVYHAFTRLDTRTRHAEIMCNFRLAGRNADGLINPGSLYQEGWAENMFVFRNERVGQRNWTRTNLITGVVHEFESGKLNLDADEVGADIEQYLGLRKMNPNNFLIGTHGAEVWYGGSRPGDHDRLDAVWDVIEQRTPNREIDFPDWPHQRKDRLRALFMRTNDFTPEQRESFEETVKGRDGDVVKFRRRGVLWRALAGIDVSRADDPSDNYDPRDSQRQALSKVDVAQLSLVNR